MSAAFGTISTLAEASSVDSVFTPPSGIQDGDLLIIYLFEFVSGGTPPTPSGVPAGFVALPGTWPNTTNAGSNWYHTYGWYKFASGESGNYTINHTVCVNRGFMLRITNADNSTPFPRNPTQTNWDLYGGNGAQYTYAGMTTTNDNELIVIMGSDNNDTSNDLTAPGGSTPTFVERADFPGEYCATGLMSPAGPTGDKTMATNSNSGQPWLATLLAIKSSVGGTPFNGSAEGGNATADGGSATYTPPISATTLTLAIG